MRSLLWAVALIGVTEVAVAQSGSEGASPAEELAPAKPPPVVVGGYVETFWQWNFARPENAITNYRAFDNRHNTFTVGNVAVDARWDVSDVVGRLALQIGHTPSTYYMAEPRSPGGGGANDSDAALWKYVQQANLGYRFHLGPRTLTVEAGIFLSPIGPESMVVHENWHWSRSNLFMGLPFYHTGVRGTLAVSEAWTLALAAYNGWNSVVDNNGRKSLSAQAVYAPSDALTLGLLYFGGVERSRGSVEGAHFRHLWDAHVTYRVTERLSMMAELDAGFEPTRLGSAAWGAGALSLRIALVPKLWVAVRGDVLGERVPEIAGTRAGTLFFPSAWVAEGTLTLDYQPAAFAAFRLEYRHDQADARIYYGRRVGDPALPSRRSQDTLTLGATAWF